MRRPGLGTGVALVALGVVSLVEAWRLRDGWLGARLMPLGFPDLNVVGWQGLTGPKGLPAPIVAQWVRLIEDASKDPAFIEQAVRINKVLAYRGPDAFWAFQNEELTKYLPLATKMGIRK